MDADLIQQQATRWINVEEEEWSGVNDCGAIFVPDHEMGFEIDDEEWLMQSGC